MKKPSRIAACLRLFILFCQKEKLLKAANNAALQLDNSKILNATYDCFDSTYKL